MKKRIAIIFALSLGGCATSDNQTTKKKPIEEMSYCEKGMAVLGNPHITPAQSVAVLKLMENNGCLGQPKAPR